MILSNLIDKLYIDVILPFGRKKDPMIPELLSREIGNVEIFELRGILAEPWVRKILTEMTQTLKKNDCAGLLINVRGVEKVDDSGAETLLKLARSSPKSGIWGRNLSAYFIAEHMNPQEPVPVFDSEEEIIGYFSREFVNRVPSVAEDRRHFLRIRTALPVEMELSDFDQKFSFQAVVTNLSEGGLYSYFLDSSTEELAGRLLDPFDLRLIKMRLHLAKNKKIDIEGKLIRTAKDFSEPPGTGIEFYNLKSEDRQEIQGFLQKNNIEMEGSGS